MMLQDDECWNNEYNDVILAELDFTRSFWGNVMR